MASIMSRLVQIEENQTEGMNDLHNYLESRIKGAMQKLGEYLKSNDVRARFTRWTLNDVPKAESSWEVTKSNITKALEHRLREIIEHWEKDHKVFLDVRRSLLQHFQQRYEFVEGQLQKLQVAVTNDDSNAPESIPADGGLTTREKVVIGVTSPLWVPFTLFVLAVCAPVIGRVAIKNKMEEKKRIKEYERDKCTFMQETSAIYLDYATKEKQLKLFVKDQLKEANLCLKQIEARIPELIEADKRFYRRLGHERRSKKEIKELYQPIVDKASDISCHMAAFQDICSGDISSAELHWKEDKTCRIGSGAFATVYQGKIRRQGEEQTVALKVATEMLDAANANLIKAKVDLLRKLDHPHIVKFYGTSLLKKAGTPRVVLVMEKCKGNLKNQIFDNPEAAPAKTRNPDVFREVCRWAKEITDAVAFMHKQWVVHRDLKLENILLSEDNSVRITDVGLSKDVKDMTSTLAGTPVYIAPEAFHSKLYDSKADIYSFGIMLWEMWYGRQAFVEFKGTRTPLFNFVDGDHRLKDMEGSKEPPVRWKQLMSRCWDGKPEQRPSAKICFQEIITILSDDVV